MHLALDISNAERPLGCSSAGRMGEPGERGGSLERDDTFASYDSIEGGAEHG